MTEITTPRAGAMEHLSDAERELFEALGPAFEEERVRVAKLLASKADRELFGETEFGASRTSAPAGCRVAGRGRQVAAKKRGGTRVLALLARTAGRTPVSSTAAKRPSSACSVP